MKNLTTPDFSTPHSAWCDRAACSADDEGNVEHRSTSFVLDDADHAFSISISRSDEVPPWEVPAGYVPGDVAVRLHIGVQVAPDAPKDEAGWFRPDPEWGPVPQVGPHLTLDAAEALFKAGLRAVAEARLHVGQAGDASGTVTR